MASNFVPIRGGHQRVRVGAGDILLVRTGHARRLIELDLWDTRAAKAGLHPTAATFLADGSGSWRADSRPPCSLRR